VDNPLNKRGITLDAPETLPPISGGVFLPCAISLKQLLTALTGAEGTNLSRIYPQQGSQSPGLKNPQIQQKQRRFSPPLGV